MRQTLLASVAVTALCAASVPAFADDQPAGSGQAAPADQASSALTNPTMVGPLAANPNPINFDVGHLGKIYVSGALTGFAQTQDNPGLHDHNNNLDLSNGQVIVQKADGLFQFYVQAGTYSLPALGTPYLRSSTTTDDTYGAVPVAYAKLAPSDSLSFEVGKLTTLIGAEYTFTFENMNVNRGLLWNQENAVTRGIQANYTVGPLALSAQWTDGFYSDRFNWLTGSASYTIDSANSVSFVAGGNLGDSATSTAATPEPQNNSSIYNLVYTYNSGPWTISPYLQYTHVPEDNSIGLTHDASTLGGALLGKYSFASGTPLEGVSLPVRFEYISSQSSTVPGAPNLLYGANSDAWSITITPTYQYNIFFARAEASYVGLIHADVGDGLGLGKSGTEKSQARLVLETGLLF